MFRRRTGPAVWDGGSDGRSLQVGHGSTTVPGYKRAPEPGRISPMRNMGTPSGPVEMTSHR